MEKIITVIKFNDQYIVDFQYSQGYLDEVLTPDPLKAMDYSNPQDLDTAMKFYGDPVTRIAGGKEVTIPAGIVEKFKVRLEKILPIMEQPVEALKLRSGIRHMLTYTATTWLPRKIVTIGDLCSYSGEELRYIKFFGPKCLIELERRLEEHGLKLKGK